MSPFDPLAELRRLPENTLLMLGSEGFAVRLLKRALAVHGFGPAEWQNFNKPVASLFDEGLQAVVLSFQRARALEVDGVAGPKTLKALGKAPLAASPAPDPQKPLEPLMQSAMAAHGSGPERAVAAAKKALELHIRESGGENRGPLVEAIQIYAARSRFFPWCAAFCDVCMRFGFEAAGQALPLTVGISCSDLVRRAAKQRRVFELDDLPRHEFPGSKVEVGDLLVLRGGPTGYKHIGIVSERRQGNGSIALIEGNTNDAGSAEGDGVYRKLRNPRTVPVVIVRVGG